MKRRHFIQTSALATAGAVLYSCGSKSAEGNAVASEPRVNKAIGLQLYSLRENIRANDAGTSYFSRNDIMGVLESVAKVGFKELECFDYRHSSIFDIPYTEFNSMVTDLGMKITSGHYKTGQVDPEYDGSLINGWENAVEDAAKVGQEYMVVASMDVKERGSIDQIKRVCQLINQAGEICTKNGVKMGYHNHDYEFAPIDGQIPYDVMLQELDPSIAMELDLYWVTFAGKDPLAYFAKYPGRFEQWHVKDMNKSDRTRQTDVGTGSIDFKAIFAKAELSGMKHFYLEQENYDVSPMDSINKGYTYLQSL